jgi:hypothetical protein
MLARSNVQTGGAVANDTGIPASGGLKRKLVKRLNLRFQVSGRAKEGPRNEPKEP